MHGDVPWALLWPSQMNVSCLEALPNNVRAACKAGSALLFDTACWHTALGNSSGNDRQNVIMGYNTVTPLRNTGGLLSPESLSALDKLGRLEGDARRRLLGVQ